MTVRPYFSPWRDETVACAACGWAGVGHECALGEMYDEVFELACPRCGDDLIAILFPTIAEARQHEAQLGAWDRRRLAQMDDL